MNCPECDKYYSDSGAGRYYLDIHLRKFHGWSLEKADKYMRLMKRIAEYMGYEDGK